MVFACNVSPVEVGAAGAMASVRPPVSGAVRAKIGFDADQPVNEPPELSAEQLAERSQAGSLEAFEQIVRRFEAHVFNFLHQLTQNRQDAEDLTQVTFVKAYRNLRQYDCSLAFAPWLFTIARRTAISHFRAAEQFEELPAEGGIEEEDPSQLLASKDDQSALWRLARSLKPKQWEALWLRYGEGFSVAETARIMRTSAIHVKVLLHRGRRGLSQKITARRRAGSPSISKPPATGEMKGVL